MCDTVLVNFRVVLIGMFLSCNCQKANEKAFGIPVQSKTEKLEVLR